MASTIVSNSYVSTNPDIPVKTSTDSGAKVQHVNVDNIVSTAYSTRMDEGATYTYIGKASPGSAEGSAVWQIARLTNANTTIVYANGSSSFDQIWTNRAILSYS
jgi:hypothetical protein